MSGSPDNVATVDKKGIVIRKPDRDQAGSQAPPKNPEKPGREKMATVLSTYVTQRHVRSADEALTDVSNGENRSDTKPKPQNKITWGSLMEGPEETVAHLKKSVDQRLPKGNELVCVLDGERYLWTL